MAEYFRVLASHAAHNRLAIVDCDGSPSSPPTEYSYAELLSRVTVFSEHLLAGARRSGKQLVGARIGLLVPPGVDFIAAVLSIWTVKAIVGKTRPAVITLDTIDRTITSPDMFYTSTAGDDIHCDRLGPRIYHIPFKFSVENRATLER